LRSLPKRTIVAAWAALAFPLAAQAVTLQAGFWMGSRTVLDSKIKASYGSGSVVLPTLQASVWRKLFVGASFETGYEKNASLGVYFDPTTLSVQGFDVFLGYEFGSKAIAATVKAGYGLFQYKQTVVGNAYVADYKVDHRQSTVVAAVGLKIYPKKFFFVAGEAKFVPLKVRPYDYEVDLGGWRFLGGLGLSFDL
jgi:hypothetical protein